MNKIQHTSQSTTAAANKGGFYYDAEKDETYILIQVGGIKFALVSINSGHFWSGPWDTANEAFTGRAHTFTRVLQPFTVTPQ